MKPIDSYSAIDKRLDRSALNEARANTANGAAGTEEVNMSDMNSMTDLELAIEKPLFDTEKVLNIKQQIAYGKYHVDTDALALKMLDAGVLGVASKN